MTHLVFRDYLEAAVGLADALSSYKQTRASILAVSCAALPMARLIADMLGAQLRLAGMLAVRATASFQVAIASRRERAESSPPLGSPETKVGEAGMEDVQQALLAQAQAHLRRCGICSSAGLAQRTIIVLDDGSATPSTIEAALRMVRVYGPALLVYAAPVTTTETLARASGLADACIYLAAADSVNAVAAHFLEYPVVTDREAVRALFPKPMRWGDGDGTCARCLSLGTGKP
ncbi:phosphoribosyltransferase family protein [Stenotrophomonas sp. PS02300]|uniref:phosphoribosyltransferase family protein n=1 Tax=Stenotrophomonas sp. PS02300 TaxID=2991426 RepID=UPI00249A41C6|nr:phosphoribosyltransferase family protein [Stenotrophomonas sp. PS02300]